MLLREHPFRYILTLLPGPHILGESWSCLPPTLQPGRDPLCPAVGISSPCQAPRVDRVRNEGKRDPCPGWVTLTPAKVPEPQSCDSLSF